MTANEQTAIHFFKSLVEPFIAHPQSLIVTAQEGPDWISIRPQCDSRDFGRIVGAAGKTYKLLALLSELAGKKIGKKFVLQRMPNTHGERETQMPPRCKQDWNGHDTEQLQNDLTNILQGILLRDFSVTAVGDTSRTTLRLKLDNNEPLSIQHEELIEGVGRIMAAVGKVRGREVSVTEA